ncbi:GNAT family N-acetyltransferase [uncultured Schumannella sp.]|uniref:GNAT family N-acetyltransferase n=1 Tax=uncultured Schumannella sp. TaxID=1195956 RepID=UPI0025E9E003|nr:GNAT family N-acetyltransferase [uncultured Schumannella sp.]
MTAPSLTIREVPWSDPAGDALRESQQAEVRALYGGNDTEPGPKPTGDDIALFLVAFEGDQPVGCGALRAIDAEHGEIKRMFVVPERRGAGIAEAIVTALEQAARERGWNRVVLETGHEQRAALKFYARAGYREIPLFGYYVDSAFSLCFEKSLRAD